MKKLGVGRTILGCVIPLIIFFAADSVISFVAMFIFSFMEMMKVGAEEYTPEVFTQVLTNSTNAFYKYSLYFVALRSVIITPIYFVLMNRDKKKEIAAGTFVKYEKFNKLWLLLVVPIGIFGCIAFNNLVMMIAELAQDFIEYIIDVFNLGITYDIFAAFNDTSEILYSGGLLMQIFTSCICAPLVEELLFRGFIHRKLNKIMSFVPAMLISSLLFGIIHGNIIQGIYAFLIGMICAFVYDKFKNIWAPIILHASANTFAVLSTYFTADSEGVGLNLGAYMLYTVVMLVGTFGLLFLLQKKFNRKEIQGEL